MKCDDLWPVLATGGPLRRLEAKLHASRCERCAAEVVRYRNMQQQLAQPGALSTQQRRLWEQAAVRDAQPAVLPLRQRPRLVFAGAALAALVVAAASMALLQKPFEPPDDLRIVEQQIDRVRQVTVSVQPLYTADELSGLERGLDQAAADLDRMEQLIALAEARRQANHLMIAYSDVRSPRPVEPPGPTPNSPPDVGEREAGSSS